ncbi:MAG: YegS/Rv2252/BmrU family lipid kinase [Bacteroidales bacterium]|nr:YegS/Rv2252/BmrU family lipid kinase [Bacteroidales bacterium]
MHLLFIVNPISGIGRQNRIEKVINENLDKERFTYEIRHTECIHDGTRLAREAVAEGGFDAIVAVGGDGSINDVVTGMRYSDIPMGIVPCGSGNGLARNLKLPLTPALAIKVINQFHVECIDTVSLNDYTYASIAGVGFDALVARRMKMAKRRGLKAYADIIINDYPTSQEHLYKMTIDGKEIERSAWFISLANSNQFGFETRVAPLAKLDDGLIDVCIVGKIPLAHIPLTAPLLYLNHFQYSQHVEMFKAKEVIIHNNDSQWVNIDGEGEQVGTELHFVNHPRSLNILCRPSNYRPVPTILEHIEKDIRHLKNNIR